MTQNANTTESYTYDPVGNRLSSLGVSPYVNNTSNELTSTPNASYSYDYNGNTTSKTVSAGTTNYTWDYENRLASVTLPGTSGSITFKYDPFGRRVQKAFTQNSTTTTTNYLYDGSNAVADIDQNGNVLARYAETQNIDEPLAELMSGTTSYYESDGLGSVTSLTSGAGAIANTYTYDSFGNLTASTGSITNRFQYTAREFDPESGLYYYRARYYDPSVGRFLSQDPVEFQGGVNFYAYVRNQPTKLTDPTGLVAGCPWYLPQWLCDLFKSPPEPNSNLQTCLCTRTMVKPQSLIPGGVLWCFYTCECAPGKTFITRWARLKLLKDCKDITNCPYQLFGIVDAASKDKTPTMSPDPDPHYPVTKEPQCQSNDP